MSESVQSPPADRGSRAVSLALALAGIAGLACTIAWGATGGPFWPAWVWLSVATAVALLVCGVRFADAPPGPQRRLALHAEVSAVLAANMFFEWLFGGGGTFWPIWVWLGLGVALALHALVVHRDEPLRERQLAERVAVLTRTRRGALDVQAAELRRIERDLHDGAQARLVALSMQLGRAEARLDDRPEVAELLRDAREEASAAIAELRDLARGIAPPVLADRGLAAAVEAIATRSPAEVTVDARIPRRLPPVVETAAYFVVAEALTNVAKHARGASARVTLRELGERLLVEVADDGPGGADPSGSGIDGLRARVEALDGALTIDAPAGGPTVVRAELPCAS
ncbi:MAG TPA: sensor histidine kinase [Conexibacter sp.]|nr:sensor histidine kinase [Conexibacter sp.]